MCSIWGNPSGISTVSVFLLSMSFYEPRPKQKNCTRTCNSFKIFSIQSHHFIFRVQKAFSREVSVNILAANLQVFCYNVFYKRKGGSDLSSQKKHLHRLFPFSWRDLFISVGILFLAAVLCIFLQKLDGREGFASPIFVLAVLLISHLTTGYLFGLLSSAAGVVCVNFIFTYPYWNIDFSITGYPVTFLSFLAVSVITCALTNQVRGQQQLRAENEKEKMRANLLRSVSHDIRTPLTSIVGSTSAILENPELSAVEQKELLEDVRNEAQWLIRVVENLLSITRIGNNQTTRIEKTAEVAEEILGDLVLKFRRRFPAVHITVEIPDELLIVPMDPILIVQVLSNLLENAVIHGKSTTKIRVFLQRQDDFARFSVIDNGEGIPERILPTLFDGALTHTTPSSAADGKRNMGLGLSVCSAIVRAHGGTMEARNTSDGAEFSFCLPLDS